MVDGLVKFFEGACADRVWVCVAADRPFPTGSLGASRICQVEETASFFPVRLHPVCTPVLLVECFRKCTNGYDVQLKPLFSVASLALPASVQTTLQLVVLLILEVRDGGTLWTHIMEVYHGGHSMDRR